MVAKLRLRYAFGVVAICTAGGGTDIAGPGGGGCRGSAKDTSQSGGFAEDGVI